MSFWRARNTGGGNVRENAVIHVRFNLEKETHRQAYEALRQADRNAYPTYADAVAAALVRLFVEDRREMDVPGLVHACADRIAEAVAERLLASLPAGLTATRTSIENQPRDDARSETSRVSEQNAGGASADYIPDEEIPWDFLNP